MAEIKINDLSIDDWVRYRDADANVRVNAIYSDGYVFIVGEEDSGISESVNAHHHIEPIPLTPAILEKNGFVESSKYRWSNTSIGCACLRLGTKYWDIRINGRNRAYRPTRISIDNILHTHQLQHALRLAGVGKDIEL